MIIIQGRNVSWNRATVPRKAKQTGNKNKDMLTTSRVSLTRNPFITSSQVGPADPKWDEWLNMEINVLDIPRFVPNLFLCMFVGPLQRVRPRNGILALLVLVPLRSEFIGEL